MNTLMQRYGIFTKDIKILLWMMLVVFGIQFLVMFLLPPLFFILNQLDIIRFGIPFKYWFPKVQVSMSIILALIAAGHWWAEERGGGTTDFLYRLPISKMQLWVEKTLAGFTCIVIVIFIQCLWYALLCYFGYYFFINIDGPLDEFFYILFNVTVYAFIVGLPISYRIDHTIGVIVIGLAMFMPGVWIASMIQDGSLIDMKDQSLLGMINGLSYFMSVLPMLLLICMPILLYIYYSWKYTKPNPKNSKPFWVLVQKQYREMRGYFIAAVLLLILSIVSIFSSSLLITGIMWCTIMVASLLTGIATYTNEEKGGLNSLLYHHPIPLTHVYWSKILPSLGIAIVLAAAFVITFLAILFTDDNSIAKYFYFKKPSDVSSIYPLTLMEFYLPVCMLMFFTGLLPFAVGVLMSHIVPNTVYAFIESVPFVIGATVCFIYLQFADEGYVLEMMMNLSEQKVMPIPTVPLVVILLSLLLMLAAWRTATDRRLLTSSILQRQFYVARLYLLVIALTILAFKVGYWDTLYLVTGIDLGIG